MRRTVLCFIAALLLPMQVALATIATDIAAGMSPVQAAANALQNGMPARDVVNQLVAAGVDVPNAVAAVAANADCDPTVEAVRTGVRREQGQAGVITDGAIAANPTDCPCCSQIVEMAATTAPEHVGDVVRAAVGNYTVTRGGCGCTNDVVDAAIRAAPDKADTIIAAAIARTPNGAGVVVDSIGQVGFDPGNEWGEGFVSTRDNTLRRRVDACARDIQEEDVFDPSDAYQGHSTDHADGLGYHSENCPPAGELTISEYVEGSGNNRALEIYNGTGQVMDLGGQKYAFELYYDGEDSPGHQVRLSGTMQPGDVFILADDNASDVFKSKANQTGSLDFDGSDAIVLVKYPRQSDCQCAYGLVQAGLSLVPDQWEAINNSLRRDWLYGCWLNASTFDQYSDILGVTLLTPLVDDGGEGRSILTGQPCTNCGAGWHEFQLNHAGAASCRDSFCRTGPDLSERLCRRRLCRSGFLAANPSATPLKHD